MIVERKKVDKTIECTWIYSFMLLILITTGGYINATHPNASNLLNVVILILSIKPMLYFFSVYNNLVNILMIGIIWIFVNWILNIDNTISSIILLVKVISIFSLVMYSNLKGINLHEYMYKLISFISIYSLIFYIVIQILKLSIPYTVIDTGNYVIYRIYFNIYSWNQTFFINGKHLIRNSSIFWEPGMYQIFLNYALYYLLYMKNEITFRDKINNILIIISILTTISTSGIILMIILLVLKLYSIKSKSKMISLVKLYLNCFLLFTSIIAILYAIELKYQMGSISFNDRTTDLLAPISLFLQKPLLGWGFLNYDIYTSLTGNNGNSNGLSTLLYQTGILGASFYMYSIILLSKRISYNRYAKLGFIIFFVVSNMTEPIIYSNFTFLFLSMGYYGLTIREENKVKELSLFDNKYER